MIVTGGSRGLGAGIVRSYLESGDRVATCARSRTPEVEAGSRKPATASCSRGRPVQRRRRSEFVKAVVERWGHVDVLVNNAGVARDGVLALFSDDDIDTVIDLNLKGTLHMSRR